MKSEQKMNDPVSILISALTGRLDAEAARDASETERRVADREAHFPGQDAARAVREQISREKANTRRDVDGQAAALLQLDRPCRSCHGSGYHESEERADVPGYRVVRHRGDNGYEDAYHVDAPRTTLRTVCALCAGRGRILTDAGVALLANLAQILRDQIQPAAAGVDGFNVQARADLAARAKTHEVERARHEAADRLERDAAEKAAAIRAGKVPAEGAAVRK